MKILHGVDGYLRASKCGKLPAGEDVASHLCDANIG